MMQEGTTTHHGTLRIVGKAGDVPLSWDASNPTQVAIAAHQFDALRAQGYRAYRHTHGTPAGDEVTVFDPRADELILVGPMMGGAC